MGFGHLAALQAGLAEGVEAGEHFGRDEGSIAHRTLGVGAGEAATSQR